MSAPTSHVSPYGRYVGRIGALAAAFGIGVMVITTPCVANATTSTDSSSSNPDTGPGGAQEATPSDTGTPAAAGTTPSTTSGSPSPSDPSTTAGGTTTTVTTNASGATSSSTRLGRVTFGNSGGAHISDKWINKVKDALGQAESGAPTDSGATTDTAVAGAKNPTPALVSEQLTSTPAKTTWKSAHLGLVHAATAPSLPAIVSTLQKTKVDVADTVAGIVKLPSAAIAPGTGPAVQLLETGTAVTRVLAARASGLTVVPAALNVPTTQIASTGPVAFLNHIVSAILNPFLGQSPTAPATPSPIGLAVLAWVRRSLFNQSPTISYNPTTTVQTGQTVTGNIGATDREGDPLTYTVTQAPQSGKLTIDQATGNFTYTPNQIDYVGTQTDSFTVSVTDGDKVNLLGLFTPRTDQTTIDLTVQPPTVERTIVPFPSGFTDAAIPRFAADGKSLLFSATPPGAATGARQEIYQVNVDGTDLTCMTCGLVDSTPLRAGTTAPRDLFKPVPFEDGSGRILMQSVDPANGSYTNVIYEPDTGKLVRVITPAGKPGVVVIDPQREMRVSPDGTHVLFSQIQLVPNPSDPPGFLTSVPIVGTLTYDPVNKVYNITDARVVAPVGEGKQFTHDGKGVIVQGGLYDAGNVDDIEVDLATGNVTRLTGNLDYDEDADLSPNNQWIAIDSGRGQEMLTPASRIVRPAFVPLLIQGSVYTAYAGTSNAQNVTNQPSVIAVADDLNREDGLPLFVNGDGWTARSMPSWNADGTEVAFWEANATGQSRLVVANLQYTTSAATPLTAADQVTPALSSTLPTLTSNTPQQVALPPTGTYRGTGGKDDLDNIAVVTQTADATTGHIIRTVVYTNYVDDEGMILNGTESTDQSAAQNTIHYVANITVSGTHKGSLTGDVTINKLTRTITPTTATSQIQSTLDGDTQVLMASIGDARAGV